VQGLSKSLTIVRNLWDLLFFIELTKIFKSLQAKKNFLFFLCGKEFFCNLKTSLLVEPKGGVLCILADRPGENRKKNLSLGKNGGEGTK
jgi:hypothetical protein